jgi:transposase-like protein
MKDAPTPERPLCDRKTVSGEPCRNRAMVGATSCGAHLRTRDEMGGKPTLLTPERIEQLVAVLRAGNYIGVAARAAGVGERTLREWMQRGTSDAERERPFREFRERVEAALSEGEVRNVALIAAAASENWLAAAWLLERHFPERWSKASTRVRLPTVPPEEQSTAPAASELDEFAELDELAAKRLARSTR